MVVGGERRRAGLKTRAYRELGTTTQAAAFAGLKTRA
jgi:hypothetical protein